MAARAPFAPAAPPIVGPPDCREDPRLDFIGEDVRMMVDGIVFLLRLKNLSSKGVCGLTDAPVAHGQMVTLVLNKGEQMQAEIRWTKKAMIGIAFAEALEAETMQRLRSRHRTLQRRRAR